MLEWVVFLDVVTHVKIFPGSPLFRVELKATLKKTLATVWRWIVWIVRQLVVAKFHLLEYLIVVIPYKMSYASQHLVKNNATRPNVNFERVSIPFLPRNSVQIIL